MRKIFLALFSVLFTFILLVGTEAKAVTLNFDNNQTLDSIKSNYGITFENTVIVTGSGYGFSGNGVGAISTSDNTISIKFDAPLTSFSCDKWEPSKAEGGTVHWKFLDLNGNTVIINEKPAIYDNATTGRWVEGLKVTFDDTLGISAIAIWGTDIAGDGAYYLDNINLEFGTNNGSAVPEPSALCLLCFGLMGLASVRRKLQK